MQLTHLSLTNFRNYTRLDIDVPGGTVMLVGNNAQGKTSLLEAIYFLATFNFVSRQLGPAADQLYRSAPRPGSGADHS